MNQLNALLLVWLSVVTVILFLFFLVAEQRDDLMNQAVERGYAEWVVNPNGRTTSWQWKEAAK